MRTIYPTVVVIALGIAALMIGMSGFENAVGEQPTDGLQSDDELAAQANNSSAAQEDGLEGSAGQSDDGDIVGLIITSGQAVARFAFMVVLLPLELQRMGFPRFFAYPVGLAGQVVASIGVAQFARGGVWR